MIYNEANPLDDTDGDTVVIQANFGRTKDKGWVRNYTKAKELASTGKIQGITAKVNVTKEPLHTIQAFRECIGAGYPCLGACVVGERESDVEWVKERVGKLVPIVCEGGCEDCNPKPKRGRPKKVVEEVQEPAPDVTGPLDMKSIIDAE